MGELIYTVDTALVVPANLMPIVQSSDLTIRDDIAYNQAGMDLNWNFVTEAGVYSQTNVVPTTAGVYDWTLVGNGMYKIEIPASGGGSINNNAIGFGWFTGFATGLVAWRSPIIEIEMAGNPRRKQAKASAIITEFTVDTVTNTHTPTRFELQADDITENNPTKFENARMYFSRDTATETLRGASATILEFSIVGGIAQFIVDALPTAPANNDFGIIIT